VPTGLSAKREEKIIQFAPAAFRMRR